MTNNTIDYNEVPLELPEVVIGDADVQYQLAQMLKVVDQRVDIIKNHKTMDIPTKHRAMMGLALEKAALYRSIEVFQELLDADKKTNE